MNGNCHFVFGAACGTAIALNLDKIATVIPVQPSPEMYTLFILGGLVGGILPDIDNPNSYIGKLTVPVSTGIGAVQEAFGKTGSRHRGLLHDPIVYLIGLWLSFTYFPALLGLFVGCLTHLFLDMFNPSGIPFLFGLKHIHLGRIYSGSIGSVIFTWIWTAVVVVTGIFIHYRR